MKLRTFAIGVLWAGFAALAPVATIVLDDVHTGKVIDWPQTWRLSAFNGAAGIAAYWRKHKALLKFPPDLQLALEESKD